MYQIWRIYFDLWDSERKSELDLLLTKVGQSGPVVMKLKPPIDYVKPLI